MEKPTVITHHQYLEKYPIETKSERLIVGTIHPHEHDKFIIPFFYGNMIGLWRILSDAFPEELPNPKDLDCILIFLEKRKLSLSDTVRICERKKLTSFDDDLDPLELNHQIKDDLKNSNIQEVFFTSGFGKNNAFKLFYVDILGRKITSAIKAQRQVTLEPEVFGRPIKLTILYSPSGSSNIGLVKSQLFMDNMWKYKNSKKPIYDFKVDYYREKFAMR